MADIVELLEITVQEGASDLHICAGSPPIIRIDGDLVRLNRPVLMPKETKEIAYSVLNEYQKNEFEKNLQVDLSTGIRNLGRFRVNVYSQREAMSIAFRSIPNDIRSFDEAGIPSVVSTLCDKPNGIVLVTGPTGSGKSTTLATMVDKINSEKPVHILTIEDPIEFLHKSKKAIVNQRELGTDFRSFPDALRAALRQDPDVVLVGEMRDRDTMELALRAAETGHLVMTTLHTNSCAQTIGRIIDTFPENMQEQIRTQLGMMLQGVVTQKLLPKIGGGRVLSAEIMIGTPAINSLIRENKVHQLDSMIQVSQKYGMMTSNQHLVQLVKEGLITKETAIHACNTEISVLMDLMSREGIR
ncbi:MAG: type IV pilus twitching motility protein PilT [Candidatus Delongbacteria bacterium]|jgi:twitching motility protein PilT|nr:type IV pilus twitching motility protein PilT [Candidatus Delongbacteria bacterium]MDD4205663.1 type IV pilus twitching motility protein PilT [Candidatus Delongbacteria bacterium]MDY0016782.1 type IV pilus twitching motility protein PilT [Candidatus Delongbacteria bacterium]